MEEVNTLVELCARRTCVSPLSRSVSPELLVMGGMCRRLFVWLLSLKRLCLSKGCLANIELLALLHKAFQINLSHEGAIWKKNHVLFRNGGEEMQARTYLRRIARVLWDSVIALTRTFAGLSVGALQVLADLWLGYSSMMCSVGLHRVWRTGIWISPQTLAVGNNHLYMVKLAHLLRLLLYASPAPA